MHQHQRTISIIAIFVMVFLAACSPAAQPVAPASQPQAEPAAASAPAAPQTSQALSPVADAPTAAPTDAPAPTPTRPPLPPTVISVKPDRGEEQVIAAPVIVTFDQPMDPASTSAAFSIEPEVAGDVVVKGDQLTFTPTERMERGLEYRITVAASAKSASGLQLLLPVAYKFKTVGFLEVTSTQPADETAGVPIDTPITIAFNRPVVPLDRRGRASRAARTADHHPHAGRHGGMDQHQHLSLHPAGRHWPPPCSTA